MPTGEDGELPTRAELSAVRAEEWAEVKKFCPYYVDLVPKEYEANVEYRKRALTLLKEPKQAKSLRHMCSKDVLFHINTFVMAYAPKRFPAHPVQPFVTYPAQSVAITLIVKSMGILPNTIQRPVHFRKSREVGGTWNSLASIEWGFQYHKNLSFLVLSATEDKVDELENLDTLMERLRFIIKWLPVEMRPAIRSRTRHLYNKDNKSIIDGAATTRNTARGGYRTHVFYDELAAVPFGSEFLSGGLTTSDAPLYVSTEMGMHDAFFLLGKKDNVKIRMPWWRDPAKTEGMYYNKNGQPRSEWWHRQKEKSVSDAQFAREIEGDASLAGGMAFDMEIFDDHKRRHCLDEMGTIIPPTHVGNLDYDPDTGEPYGWQETAGGSMRLWIPLISGRPEKGLHVIASDVATGRGASLSVSSVVNLELGRKVAEFASPYVAQHIFAAQTVAMCHWFLSQMDQPAFLIWEDNGPGTLFGGAVEELEFTNIYYRYRGRKRSTKNRSAGWWNDHRQGLSLKNMLLSNYVRALKSDTFINPSPEALEECKQFVYKPDGAIVHSGSIDWEDPTGARANHGDRVTADALACKILLTHEPLQEKKEKKKIPSDSMLGRYLAREAEGRKVSRWL